MSSILGAILGTAICCAILYHYTADMRRSRLPYQWVDVLVIIFLVGLIVGVWWQALK